VSLVWPNLHAASDGWIGSAILLDRTPTGILDRGAPLDDASDRDGSAIGGLLEGSPGERARCPRGVSIGEGHRCIGILIVDRLAALPALDRASFNYLVGSGEKRFRDGEIERLCRLEVHD
jgi:hypothetical protein